METKMNWKEFEKEKPTGEESNSYLVQILCSKQYTDFRVAEWFDGDEGLYFYGGRNGDEPIVYEGDDEQIIAWTPIIAFTNLKDA